MDVRTTDTGNSSSSPKHQHKEIKESESFTGRHKRKNKINGNAHAIDEAGLSEGASSALGVQNEHQDDSSVEDTIVTPGAQATLSGRKTLQKPHRMSEERIDKGYIGENEAGAEGRDDPQHRHVGFPPVEELPKWFPKNIKQIYRVDRHGGALSYNELNEITRYRTALELIRRRKWKTYIEAGRARWKLQQALHRLRCRPLTSAFYGYRKKQFKEWREKGLKAWKGLEKTHLGILILDETINLNFRQERIIWEKSLGGRL